MAEVDPYLPRRLKDQAVIIAGERVVDRLAKAALDDLSDQIRNSLAAVNYDPGGMNRLWPVWQTAVERILAAIGDVYHRAYVEQFGALTAATMRAGARVIQYLRAVRNRLVNVAGPTFAKVRRELRVGTMHGESIPQLADRVDAVLDEEGADNWKNRARTIARTEVVSAYNNARLTAGLELAELTSTPADQVVKMWLATHDNRTRHTHVEADRQTVNINSMFSVGGHPGRGPGDVILPPQESINCRCTLLVLLPGDPGYPAAPILSSAAPVDNTDGIVIAALPADDDPIHDIGDEPKHLTLVWLGTIGETKADPEDMEQQTREAAQGAISPFTGTIAKNGKLGADGAQVAFLEKDAPTAVRDALLANPLISDAVNAVKQHPGYLPHVTLSYKDRPEATGDIKFDRLALWWGKNRMIYPLTGTDVP